MKLSMIATGLAAAALVGTAGVMVVATVARTKHAETPVAVSPNEPAARPGAESPQPVPLEPGRERRPLPESPPRATGYSPRALWARLNAASQNFAVRKRQYQSARGTYAEVVEARGEFEALAGELNTCVDDLRDEVDLLQAQLKIRLAQIRTAEARLAKVDQISQFQEKLTKSRVVSPNEARLAHDEVLIASGELGKKQAELNEVELRIKQATRRRDEAVQLAERAKGLILDQDAATAAHAAKP